MRGGGGVTLEITGRAVTVKELSPAAGLWGQPLCVWHAPVQRWMEAFLGMTAVASAHAAAAAEPKQESIVVTERKKLQFLRPVGQWAGQ